MTPQQTLQSAIDIAVKNGWKKPVTQTTFTLPNANNARGYWTDLFSKEFALALWGEDTEMGDESPCDVCQCDTIYWSPTWQYHLREMVVSDDPIAYLAANMPEEK